MRDSRFPLPVVVWSVCCLLVGLALGYVVGVGQHGPAPVAAQSAAQATATPRMSVCPPPALCEEVPTLETAKDYLARAIDLWERGYYTIPLADVNTAIDLDPTFAEAYYYRAWIAQEGYTDTNQVIYEDLDSALIDYSHAIKLDPTLSRAYNNRGIVYLRLNDYAAGLEDFKRAVELDPAYYRAHFNLIHAASQMPFYEDVATYCKGWNEHLTDYYARFPLENCIKAAQEIGDSALELEIANDQMAYHQDTEQWRLSDDYIRRGRIYSRLGRYSEALADLDYALELSTDRYPAYWIIVELDKVQVYVAQERYARAFTLLDRVVADYPTNYRPYKARADLYYDQGEYEQALADYQQAKEWVCRPWDVQPRIDEIEQLLAESPHE